MKKSILSALVLLVVSATIAIYTTAAYNLPKEFGFEGGDNVLGEAIIKSIQEDGLWGNLIVRRLGAPEKSSLVDTPFIDWLLAIIFWVCGKFISSAGNILVVTYCLTHILSAITMYFLLRKLKCSYSISTVISLLFSFSTYATYREIGHLTLSNYFAVPLAAYLAVFIVSQGIDNSIMIHGENKVKTWILPCVFALIIGLTNIYFTAFGLILTVLAIIYRMLYTRKTRQNLKYLLLPGLIVMSVGISLLPKIIYSVKNGFNSVAGIRSPVEAEIFGLKIIQMLLPPTFSRFLNNADLTTIYMDGNPNINENSMASLGIIAGVVFLCLCAYFIKTFVCKNGSVLFDFLSLGVLVLVLFCTVGGFGAIFNYFIMPEIRCYNRVSIYIICICLIVLAFFMERHIRSKAIKCGALAMLLLIASFDQIVISVPNRWDGGEQTASNYRNFYKAVESDLAPGAMVYQLPFIEFPEVSNVERLDCYTPLNGYIYTETIRWSHGGMKGRNEKAKKLYKKNGIGMKFVKGILKNGFSGVCIDLRGYSDERGRQVIEYYSDTLGLKPIVSADNSLYFYNLSSFAG